MLNLSAIDLVRKNEKIWIEKYKNLNLTEPEIIEVLPNNPIMIERPIISNRGKACIAQSLENIFDII